MPATIKVGCFTGSSPTFNDVTAGTAAVSFDQSDTFNGTSTITIPSGSNRTFSWIRYLSLYCTVGASTTLSNVKYAIASALPTGLQLWAGVQATYTQAVTTKGTAAGNRPVDDASASAPSGTPGCTYAAMPVDPTFSSAAAGLGGAATNNTKVGSSYLQIVAGVIGTYAGGGNANTSLPNIEFQYDEA